MNTFVAISVLAGLLSLPALVVAWRRCVKQKSVLAVGMLLVMLFVTATFFSSAFRAPLFVDYITASSYQLPSGPFYACYLLAAIVVDLFAYLLARRLTGSNLWRWTLVAVITALLVLIAIAVITCSFTHLNFAKALFLACCGCIGFTGLAWGIGYEEACVIVNIYLQLAVIVGSVFWLVYMAVKRYMYQRSSASLFIAILVAVYAIGNVVAAALICQHYAMPMVEAYNLCVSDLIHLADQYNTTYKAVNFVIFIFLFIALLTLNLVVGSFLRVKQHKQ